MGTIFELPQELTPDNRRGLDVKQLQRSVDRLAMQDAFIQFVEWGRTHDSTLHHTRFGIGEQDNCYYFQYGSIEHATPHTPEERAACEKSIEVLLALLNSLNVEPTQSVVWEFCNTLRTKGWSMDNFWQAVPEVAHWRIEDGVQWWERYQAAEVAQAIEHHTHPASLPASGRPRI